MRVILKQDHPPLGSVGQVVTVADGFARNYLLPRGIALHATKRNLRVIEEEKKRRLRVLSREKRQAEALAKELEKVSLTASVAVGEEDKVFGAVTSQDIADLLREKGFEIDKRKILLDEPMKALGIYNVPIKLHPEVEVAIKVWVVKE